MMVQYEHVAILKKKKNFSPVSLDITRRFEKKKNYSRLNIYVYDLIVRTQQIIAFFFF